MIVNTFSDVLYITFDSHYSRARSGASVGSLLTFRTHLTNRLLFSLAKAQSRFPLLLFVLFRLRYIDAVFNTLKSIQTYVHWHSRACKVQRNAYMYLLPSFQTLGQCTALVIVLVQLPCLKQ